MNVKNGLNDLEEASDIIADCRLAGRSWRVRQEEVSTQSTAEPTGNKKRAASSPVEKKVGRKEEERGRTACPEEYGCL